MRALELCEQMGAVLHMLPIVKGLWATDLVCGNMEAALEHAQHFLALAESLHDGTMIMYGHGMMGLPLKTLGRLHQAYEHYGNLDRNYDPGRTAAQIAVYGQDEICFRLAEFPLVLSEIGTLILHWSFVRRCLRCRKDLRSPMKSVIAPAKHSYY